MQKLIILDRDGVINHDSPNFIKSPEEWIPIEGSLQAIAKLKHNNFPVAIATNQSGVGRGYFSLETLQKIHEKMNNNLLKYDCKIDHIFFCPHHPDKNCSCRKPKPGMLLQALKHFNISNEHTYLIGDAYRDIKAAMNAKCKPILVLTGKGKDTLQQHKEECKDVSIFKDLASFVTSFLAGEI